MAAGSTQTWKGAPLRNAPGVLAGEHRDVMPRVVDRVATTERTGIPSAIAGVMGGTFLHAVDQMLPRRGDTLPLPFGDRVTPKITRPAT